MKKKVFLNTITVIILQVVNIISAFVLPKLILKEYGTEVNGLISSISQFLTIISLSEFGITAVVQSSLYKPLAEKDIVSISKIMASSINFFSKIAKLLIVYVIFLCIMYPVIIRSKFDYIYVVLLILILSINSLSQYLLGITNTILVNADQKIYITSILGIIIVVLNTIVCCFLIKSGVKIHIVKLVTVIIFMIKPILLSIYVDKNYNIDKHIKYKEEPIVQKWNGIAQHISYYVFTSTDVIVLSLFSTLSDVSIYSVYVLVLNGLKQLCSMLENVVKPILGEYWAKNDGVRLREFFILYEWFMHSISILVFGCASSLIVEFVNIYTKNIHDADYCVPKFALVITLSYLIQNIRNPYNTMIQAAGKYKETQFNYIIVAVINIIISIIMVIYKGLIGVAIGTFIAVLLQTYWQSWYVYINILKSKYVVFLKQSFIDMGIFILGYICTNRIILTRLDYCNWCLVAFKVGIVWLAIIILSSIFFEKNNLLHIKKFFYK